MPTLTQGKRWADFLGAEANGKRSRETITVGASQTIVPGQVLGRLTSGGNYVAYNQDAESGAEDVAAIALYPATTGSGETARIAAVVRDCEVNAAELTWPGDITDNEKATAIAALAALGIIARPGV